jgi:N-methylhydantoinase A
MPALIGVDIGGTFTDVALVDDGRLTAVKLPTSGDRTSGMVDAVDAALRAAGLAPREVSHLGHGTTVATNALLERRGARTGFVTTEGFGDLLALGRQTRPSLYRPWLGRPQPLPVVNAEVAERIAPQGVLKRLDSGSVRRAARRLSRARVEAVAVCLLHSYADPSHEREVARILRAELPGAFVVASHELAAEYREYERASTTAIDAYLGPVTSRYIEALSGALRDRGLPEPLLMQSSGGLCGADEGSAHPARLVLSGPAGGVAAVVAGGARNAVAMDMGGTSCDVSLIRDGRASRSSEREVAGLPVRLPMLDIHTVGAGGGSVAWIDSGGALRVGPRSAGAEPGPACYGRGGVEPTVTDANLVLGRLDPGVPLAGLVNLDVAAARRAVQRVAGGFRSVRAAAEMVRAIRVITVERGHDPRGLELVAFGGAGPLHACQVADALGVERVVVPPASGVLSALGIAAGDRRRDAVAGVLRPLADLRAADLRALVPSLPRIRGGSRVAECDLRYAGQGFELTLPLEPVRDLPVRFHVAHQERYGFHDVSWPVEVVNVRAHATVPGAELRIAPQPRVAPVRGPGTVHLEGATLWVAPGWTASRRRDGAWEVTR